LHARFKAFIFLNSFIHYNKGLKPNKFCLGYFLAIHYNKDCKGFYFYDLQSFTNEKSFFFHKRRLPKLQNFVSLFSILTTTLQISKLSFRYSRTAKISQFFLGDLKQNARSPSNSLPVHQKQ